MALGVFEHLAGEQAVGWSGGSEAWARGSGNAFRYNVIRDNLGAGIRFGGDTPADGANNDAYDNVIVRNAAGGVKFQAP